jgi:hypothetical protein
MYIIGERISTIILATLRVIASEANRAKMLCICLEHVRRSRADPGEMHVYVADDVRA